MFVIPKSLLFLTLLVQPNNGEINLPSTSYFQQLSLEESNLAKPSWASHHMPSDDSRATMKAEQLRPAYMFSKKISASCLEATSEQTAESVYVNSSVARDWSIKNHKRTSAMGIRHKVIIEDYNQELSYIEVYPLRAKKDQAVVVLHGFPDDATAWRKVAIGLSDLGYHVFALDLPGNGHSSTPADEISYTDSHEASLVIAFIEKLGLQEVHLVGHDWGGLVTHRVAEMNPDFLVTAATIAGPHPAVLTGEIIKGNLPYGNDEQVTKSAYAKTLGTSDGYLQIAQKNYRFLRKTLKKEGLPEQEIEYIIKSLRLKAKAMMGHYRNMDPLTMVAQYGYSWLARFGMGNPKMRTPFLMIQPTNDSFFSQESLQIPNHYPNGESVLIKGGHFLPTLAPKAVVKSLIGFWNPFGI